MKSATRPPTFVLRGLLLGVLCLSTFGCQSLTNSSVTTADFSPEPEMVDVQIRPAYGSPKNTQLPLEPDMTLQQVVDRSKARFRNKLAYIVRTSPDTGETHKLEAKFGKNRRIMLQFDYAVQPGDRVVISQDTSTSFDRVMQSLLGR